MHSSLLALGLLLLTERLQAMDAEIWLPDPVLGCVLPRAEVAPIAGLDE